MSKDYCVKLNTKVGFLKFKNSCIQFENYATKQEIDVLSMGVSSASSQLRDKNFGLKFSLLSPRAIINSEIP